MNADVGLRAVRRLRQVSQIDSRLHRGRGGAGAPRRAAPVLPLHATTRGAASLLATEKSGSLALRSMQGRRHPDNDLGITRCSRCGCPPEAHAVEEHEQVGANGRACITGLSARAAPLRAAGSKGALACMRQIPCPVLPCRSGRRAMTPLHWGATTLQWLTTAEPWRCAALTLPCGATALPPTWQKAGGCAAATSVRTGASHCVSLPLPLPAKCQRMWHATCHFPLGCLPAGGSRR